MGCLFDIRYSLCGFFSDDIVWYPFLPLQSVPALYGHNKFKGLPVLVQLATTESSIVIPLTHKTRPTYNEAVVPLLVQVLEDERMVKCGVGIEGDIHDMMKYVPGMQDLDAKSRLDLGLLGTSKNQMGLKTLTRIVVGRNLEKPRRITISNWSKNPLTKEQIAYSARDAYAGAAIAEELGKRDPSTFGVQALIRLLRKQPSVGKVHLRKKRRKTARQELYRVHQVYKTDSDMPPNVKHKVAELKKILKEAKLELPPMEKLGFVEENIEN
jgi:ribonuclease D